MIKLKLLSVVNSFFFNHLPFVKNIQMLGALEGRNVLLVDDSVVRGTTAHEIVQMAREAGAQKVYLTSAAPPIRFPNIYGIDIPTRHELIAYEKNEKEIAKRIGCDWIL